MSQCICSICSNRGPDIVYPIMPQQLFPKYLQQFGVHNKVGFITKSYREYVHFRCAFFIPKLRWVKEIFQKSHVDYVCFGLEWILTQKNKEAMCAVCQKSTRAKVLLCCAGGEHEPCNKRYHIDCVIAVRKRIYYQPGKVTLLCNEHFSQGRTDANNRVLDWIEFDCIVKQHIENSVISREQDYQSYISEASSYPRLPDLPEELEQTRLPPINDSLQQWQSQQLSKTSNSQTSFLMKQKKSNSKDKEEKDDIMNQYLFRPRALFDIDYSAKNPLLNQPVKKRNHQSGNGNGNKSQTRDSSSVESSYAQDRNRNSAGGTLERQTFLSGNDKNNFAQIDSSEPQKPSLGEERKQKPQMNQLEDNDDDIDIFARYESKKNANYSNQFKKQLVQDPLKEQLTKPQLQQLERLKQQQQQVEPIKNSQISNQTNQNQLTLNKNNSHQNESQNQIQQLQQDLEEVHNEPDMQFLGRRKLKQFQQSQSIITPKIQYQRTFNQNEDTQQEMDSNKISQKIDILSQYLPVYPNDKAINRWELMISWWSKIDEFFFTNQEVAIDFREQDDIEITLQPTIELLRKNFLSVLFQNSKQQQNYMVHYELDPTTYKLENTPCDLSEVTVFDRNLNQVGKSQNNDLLNLSLRYVEALEMNESELKDSIKLHQAIVSSENQNELDVMYFQMVKEFQDLNDRNSANLKQLQLKLNQFKSQSVNLLNIIEESVSIIDQLRWNEILKCFENGFKNKDSSVLETFDPTDEFNKGMFSDDKQDEKKQLDMDCQICFSEVNTQLNPIVNCQKCQNSFHQYCYGIDEQELIKSNQFTCDKCKQSKQACYICKKKNSPLPIKQIKGKYFHPTCVVVFDYLSLKRPLQLQVSCEQIDQAINSSVECSLCLKRKGRKIKCRECENQYHILCAYLNGFEVTISRHNRKVSAELACGVHTISLQKLVEQIFYRRYLINFDEAASYESSESYYEQRLKENIQFKQVRKIFECELIELMPRKKLKKNDE